jgi:hypothetical protein
VTQYITKDQVVHKVGNGGKFVEVVIVKNIVYKQSCQYRKYNPYTDGIVGGKMLCGFHKSIPPQHKGNEKHRDS